MAEIAHIREFVSAQAAADLVTVDTSGQPLATLMPCTWYPDDNGHGPLVMHMSRANEQWKSITNGARGLAIIHGSQAYVSPNWYPAKAEHGKVVPTWNYTAVHLSGTVEVSHDIEQLRHIVTELTDRHEASMPKPWHVSDAPEDYMTTQLGAIVAVTLHVDRVEAKAKLNQNRSEEDQAGVRDALARSSEAQDQTMSALMGESENPLG